MLKLSANLPGELLVAPACATEGEVPQEFAFFPRRERASVLMVGGKLVSEVGESELESIGEALGIEKSLRLIMKEGGNLPGVLEVPFRICGEEGARLVEGGVMAQAGKGVGKQAVGAYAEERCVGGEERNLKVGGQIDKKPVSAFLAADVVSSEGEVEVFGSEDITKPGCSLEEDPPGRISPQERFGSQKSYKAATSAGQELVTRGLEGIGVVLRRRGDPGRSCDFSRATMEIGEKAAEIMIASTIFYQERKVYVRSWSLLSGP